MPIKQSIINLPEGYAGYYENEITGIYLTMWLLAKAEAELANQKADDLLKEYRKYRLEELRSMPYADYLKSCEWQNKRKTALKDANYKCQLCGVADTEMHVHHKNYERRGEELPEDLIVLCKDCHAKHHDKEPQ